MLPGNIFVSIVLIALLLLAGVFLLLRYKRTPAAGREEAHYKKTKRKRIALFMFGVLSLWLSCGLTLSLFEAPKEKLQVEISAPRIALWELDVSTSVLISWIVTAVLILAAIIIRVFVIPKFSDQPSGIQNALEIAVDSVSKYTRSTAGELGEGLSSYIFTVAAYLVTCALVELISFRPPTADLMMTFSLALCTFTLINFFGIKKKGLKGRLRSYTQPTPIILPIKILTDIAIPVSMACRLFGNMLGGMIVMELVYVALGAFGVGIPAVLGLYFNVFHPLIQAFIFITLSLTFINEAVE